MLSLTGIFNCPAARKPQRQAFMEPPLQQGKQAAKERPKTTVQAVPKIMRWITAFSPQSIRTTFCSKSL